MSTVLEAQNLSVRYPSGALGILDVSLRVGAGQVVTLLGANGAGKTTTVRACTGFLPSEGARVVRGSVSVLGETMNNRKPHEFSQRGVAFIPERHKVIPAMTVRENLSMVRTRPDGRSRKEGLEFVFDLFPMVRDKLNSPAGLLSGGQQQMLALGRALIASPLLLVVDEITLGLHRSMHPQLVKAVRTIADSGVSVLLVDESTSFAVGVSDYCYLIAGGELVSSGTASDYLAGPADSAEVGSTL
ncbi:ATP-binding cassette domain-containing protein [Rhodococcus sp. KBS0724]|jgi:ABC-type branched-subunit amino acid transport system ATPase component|uniref:ABC transporter ATP-binding protein n=1 Tax=Rhodococcus sp. KBS0724 TaxID=1179674 RepID=UPI00110F32A7|nr:ATP-binding cassette domain-containing protein [Rhodococcus sp. KBS0724]TSD47062.1 ATP-binding cassette domain-containing protein [Rhodococcus sp. KBS0724]